MRLRHECSRVGASMKAILEIAMWSQTLRLRKRVPCVACRVWSVAYEVEPVAAHR